jgi:ribonuclease HII
MPEPASRRAKRGRRVRAASPVQADLLQWDEPTALTAGVDEAGRGPLAGPVLAAAVILDDLHPIEGLDDSKRLSERRRNQFYDAIRARALCVSVGQASVQEIDQFNILQATLLAMQRAVHGLRLAPRLVLVDGNRLPTLPMAAVAVVGGDACVPAISAASIIAKVERDRWCDQASAQYPQYQLHRHKGYGTAQHLAALREHGASPLHRTSFAPVRAALQAARSVAPEG